ncbi:MAG: ABC transporter substrate-binding protein, partial [Pseudomonadota bacterium]
MRRIALSIFVYVAMSASVFAGEIEKIASAGGDITEILFEFGVGEKVVAVDSTSIFPTSVTELPSVGYVRELSAEGVLATGADLLIGSDDMGPPAVMDNLAAAGMRVEYAPEGIGAARYPDKVRFVASVLGMEQRGNELIAAYEAELAKVASRREAMADAPRVLLILSVRDGAPIAAGTATTGHDIIEISGGENVA